MQTRKTNKDEELEANKYILCSAQTATIQMDLDKGHADILFSPGGHFVSFSVGLKVKQ